MNVKLLRKIQKHILAEPRRLRMNYWIQQRTPKARTLEPPCGTAACIAGWTCVLSGGNKSPIDTSDQAAHILELDRRQARRLFYTNEWPRQFGDKYIDESIGIVDAWVAAISGRKLNMRTIKANAALAVKRIDHFIKTKGAE